jgi:hypothetical protein
VTRRVSLPGVDELFRSSRTPPPEPDDAANTASRQVDKDTGVQVDPIPKLQVVPAATDGENAPAEPTELAPSGRPEAGLAGQQPAGAAAPATVLPATVLPEPAPVPTPASAGAAGDDAKRPRHEEKVTFYCTGSDLTRIERARLSLRADYRLASDRGRIVRAALAEILDDFEQRGADSALVRRLRSRGAEGK